MNSRLSWMGIQIFSAVLLFGQEPNAPTPGAGEIEIRPPADSLYQKVLSRRESRSLSIIAVDQALTVEAGKAVPDPARLSELQLYRGEILHRQSRLDEALSAYSSSLAAPGAQWVADSAHYKRGLVFDTLGMRRGMWKTTERLISAELFWFGSHNRPVNLPSEFARAEADYRAARGPGAAESLLRLLLVTGQVREASELLAVFPPPSGPDTDAGFRFLAYRIFLSEAEEDFDGAERLHSGLPPAAARRVDSVLEALRAGRLEKILRFDMMDRRDRDAAVSVAAVRTGAEPDPFAEIRFGGSARRLLFERENGGFLVTGRAGGFGRFSGNGGGGGLRLEALGTFLDGAWSAPGGGFSFDFESYAGAGRRMLENAGWNVSENRQSGFGFHAHAGIRHKLFAYAAYAQDNYRMNGLSARLSAAAPLFATLGASAEDAVRTDGVYGLGYAGTGWWPGVTRAAFTDKRFGARTRLSRVFTVGAAYTRRSCDLEDHEEWTSPGAGLTYAHNAVLGERLDLFRVEAEARLEAAGLRLEAGGQHTFLLSSGWAANRMTAQVVPSVPSASGIHPVLAVAPQNRLGAGALAAADRVTGYLPSASRLFATLVFAEWAVTAEVLAHGLRDPDMEVRLSLGARPRAGILSQNLHDLAPLH